MKVRKIGDTKYALTPQSLLFNFTILKFRIDAIINKMDSGISEKKDKEIEIRVKKIILHKKIHALLQ